MSEIFMQMLTKNSYYWHLHSFLIAVKEFPRQWINKKLLVVGKSSNYWHLHSFLIALKEFLRQWITRDSWGMTRRRENGILIPIVRAIKIIETELRQWLTGK